MSVLLGNGNGTFQPPVGYDSVTSTGWCSIVAGDFTGDGKLDLAVEDFGGVDILRGNGDGTFQPAITVAGIDIGFPVAGDFNGDGRLDLAVAGFNYNPFTNTSVAGVSILLGNGDGTFQPQFTDAAGSAPYKIVAGDFTGDGHLDLAVTDVGTNEVSVLLGNGDGTFQPPLEYAVGQSPYAIVAGDFNGDGRTDLAVVDDDGIQMLLGNGDGTFQPARTVAAGPDLWAIVTGDFNGDGRLDLAVSDDDGVQILLGNGDGTFQPAETVAAGISGSLVAGDFTGNGKLDLAVAGYNINPVDAGDVSVLLGNGDGSFQPPVTYPAGNNPNSIVAGNFTGNGHLDLAVSDDDGMQILLGNGDGTFQPAKTVAAIGGFLVAGGDLNGDGKLDLAVSDDDGVQILLGNGDGTFQPAKTVAAIGGFPVAGDLNGDGKLDLATANQVSNDVSLLLGNGDGTFSDPGQFATTPHATPLVADVTGDGTDDVLVVDEHGNILYRQGIPGQPGSFEPPVPVQKLDPSTGAVEFPSRDIAWVPNTLDGPLLASVDAHDDAISLYAWRDGGFVRIGSLTTGPFPTQIIAADLNGSGWDDLIVRNAGDGTLTVFFNNQLGSFWTGFDQPFLPPLTISVGLGVSDVEAISTNADGHLDLVVTNKLTGQVSVLYNDGDDRFAALVPYRAGTGLSAIDPGSTPAVTSLEATAGVAGGPLTPGGPNDLVTINPGSNTLDVLANLGGGWSFANPVTLQTASPAQVIRTGDFTGNGIVDLAVLTADGLSIYLGNGKGGFLPPTTDAVPSEADGLTLADVNHDGQLDLLVGDAYGDVLVLLGKGDGTFRPTTRPTRPSSWPWPTSTAMAPRTSSMPTRDSTAWWSPTVSAIQQSWPISPPAC